VKKSEIIMTVRSLRCCCCMQYIVSRPLEDTWRVRCAWRSLCRARLQLFGVDFGSLGGGWSVCERAFVLCCAPPSTTTTTTSAATRRRIALFEMLLLPLAVFLYDPAQEKKTGKRAVSSLTLHVTLLLIDKNREATTRPASITTTTVTTISRTALCRG
jgi:hypothetical protein